MNLSLAGELVNRNRSHECLSSRRAGERGGARVGKPRWVRILTINGGSSMAAIESSRRRREVRAVFDIDIEDPFEQPGPTHAHRRAMRVRVIGCGLGCILRWTWNDRSSQLEPFVDVSRSFSVGVCKSSSITRRRELSAGINGGRRNLCIWPTILGTLWAKPEKSIIGDSQQWCENGWTGLHGCGPTVGGGANSPCALAKSMSLLAFFFFFGRHATADS